MKSHYNRLKEIESRLPMHASTSHASFISNLFSEYEKTLFEIINYSDDLKRDLYGYANELPGISSLIKRSKFNDAVKGMKYDIEAILVKLKNSLAALNL